MKLFERTGSAFLFLSACGALILLLCSFASAFSGDGEGTAANPFRITDVDLLQEMEDDLGAHYVLMNNIDASGTEGWNAGAGFSPVGDNINPFTGSLEGNGRVLTGLYISRPGEDEVGLFGFVTGEVRNTGLVNADITGQNAVGALAGANEGAVENCFSSGSVAGEAIVGGLIGASEGVVLNSYSSAEVTLSTATGGLAGGLIGLHLGIIEYSFATGIVEGFEGAGGLVGANVMGGLIYSSYASGEVAGTEAVGGLAGYNALSSQIAASYAAGKVTGEAYVGGLVGLNEESLVADSYARGSVTGIASVGGLIGWNDGGDVEKSYSTGSVTAAAPSGGLVGLNEGTVADSFYDSQTSGRSDDEGKGEPKSTEEMKTKSTFTGAGWDFDNMWDINSANDGYPYFQWQPEAPEPDEPDEADEEEDEFQGPGAAPGTPVPPASPITTGDCFIATAAYGSPMREEIAALSRLRDRCLAGNAPGRMFISAYYRVSPAIAEAVRGNSFLKAVVRLHLAPAVKIAGWLPAAE